MKRQWWLEFKLLLQSAYHLPFQGAPVIGALYSAELQSSGLNEGEANGAQLTTTATVSCCKVTAVHPRANGKQ